MANQSKPNKTAGDLTRHIADKDTIEVWARSAGRCEICNKFLLEDKFQMRRINLGERAHIAGHKKTSRSARGDSSLPLEERNQAKNLMLLCLDCHTMVDDGEVRKDYPEQRLLEMKREHEERVFHLTGMSPDMDTTVLRIFGLVRGSMPEMAREAALQTVVKGAGRYARFPLSVDKHSLELDLSQLPDPERFTDGTYWTVGKMKVDELAVRVSDAVHQQHIRHLSVFALARIPLLVYFGYKLDDKVPVDFYQKHREESEGWLWPEDDAAPVDFEATLVREGKDTSQIAIVLSLSGSIGLSELPPEAEGLPVYEIRPKGMTPNRDLFRSRKTLDTFTRAYHGLLSSLEESEHKPETIHLFPAVPITAAIACGRGVMRHVHPAVTVYDRINNQFKPALTINER